jgi:hypothetical protein
MSVLLDSGFKPRQARYAIGDASDVDGGERGRCPATEIDRLEGASGDAGRLRRVPDLLDRQIREGRRATVASAMAIEAAEETVIGAEGDMHIGQTPVTRGL